MHNSLGCHANGETEEMIVLLKVPKSKPGWLLIAGRWVIIQNGELCDEAKGGLVNQASSSNELSNATSSTVLPSGSLVKIPRQPIQPKFSIR